MSTEQNVRERYSAAAQTAQAELCCPVDYDARLLKLLPPEIVEKDYGCGDPSRYVRTGDTVLDLGSGGGKICYLAAQIVGNGGRVIGVDMNDDMLALARKYQPEMAQRLGSDRVRFVKGYIQDLAQGVSGRTAPDAAVDPRCLGGPCRLQLRAQPGQRNRPPSDGAGNIPRAQARRARGDLGHCVG